MQYNYVVSTSHRYIITVIVYCLSAALQQTKFYCSRVFLCFVSLPVIAVQHILSDSSVVGLEIEIS